MPEFSTGFLIDGVRSRVCRWLTGRVPASAPGGQSCCPLKFTHEQSPKPERGLSAEQEKSNSKKKSKCSPWLGTVLTLYLRYLNLIFTYIFERCYFYRIHSTAGEAKPEFLHQ